ncbi:MAG: ABC transporter ATP-binding protein [Kiritimatiellia bacterium]
MDALKAVGVGRTYGNQQVLNDFWLTLEEGGFAALMGPSGSGKSTFLHLAAGLLAVEAGSLMVGGRNVAQMTDAQATKFRRRHVGVVFQAFNLLDGKTVRENIELPVKLDGGKVDAARFDRLVALLGLADKLDRRPDALSGGEQQRVAIARALIAAPDVVLADEPTGNLDAKAAKDICLLLKELNATDRCAILVVTHDPVVASCAKTVHFLKEGRIAAAYETNGDPARVSELYLETYR